MYKSHISYLYYPQKDEPKKIKAIFWDWLGTLEINSRINPFTADLLSFFHKRHMLQCIISNGSARDIKHKINQWKWNEYFAIIASNDLELPLKPQIHMMQYCITHTKCTPTSDEIILFIGDSDSDALLAQNARSHGICCEYIDVNTDIHILIDTLLAFNCRE